VKHECLAPVERVEILLSLAIDALAMITM
jgi:hypothetical protein